MNGDRRLVLVLGLLLLAAVFLYRRRAGAPPPAAHPPAAASQAAPPVPPADRAEARRARDAMRAEILDALRRRDAGPRAAPSPSPPAAAAAAPAKAKKDDDEPDGRYDPSYIQEVFHRDMFPFLKGCYADALRRKPKLAGRLVLSFKIVGDSQVGGVIEDAAFADDSDLKDPEMETCVRESLLSITFDKPPEGGGFVKVTYPVLFSPDEPGSDGG